MINQKSKIKNQKSLGFTLIELLVVIAVLGILAAGLLATVDPLEQMKKGRDTTTRNSVVEIYNGVIRFNANKGKMPWSADLTLPSCGSAGQVAAQALGGAQAMGCVTALVNEGELKSQFVQAISSVTDKIFIYGSTEVSSLCFRPESKAIRQDPATRFLANLTDGTCTPSVSSTCYWCAQ